jgi:NAD(P)-dependent dehydrogenase (short-subunit alcohol dehydrogenase family)
MNKLAGRKALVTGCARGIGREIAKALAAEGADIAINFQSSGADAESLVEELHKMGRETLLFKGNVGERPTWNEMMGKIKAAWGRIDILVNNAGITRDKTLRKMTDEDWLAVLDTNNALAPGFTETGMLAKVPEAVQAQLLARIPMGRFATPDEIAKAVLFLAADGDYVTGQQINVNGGVYM